MGDDISVKEIVSTMFENKFNGSVVAEMFTVGFFNSLERTGLNKKMDARAFSYDDLKTIKVLREDLLNAIKTIAKQKV